jgi:hypothetical protein
LELGQVGRLAGLDLSAYPTKQTNIVAAAVGLELRRLFVCLRRACGVRSDLSGWGHPQNSSPLDWGWCFANSVRIHRAIPFARAAWDVWDDAMKDCFAELFKVEIWNTLTRSLVF